ncbi:MAG: hypothetical protein VW647_02560, partial [Alphaproteobacteria bacterium]
MAITYRLPKGPLVLASASQTRQMMLKQAGLDFISRPANVDEVGIRKAAKASSIPASTVGQIEVPYFGRKVKMAGNRTFENWQVTVLNDEDFLVRNAFEKWSSFINSHENNLRDSSVIGEQGLASYRTVAT